MMDRLLDNFRSATYQPLAFVARALRGPPCAAAKSMYVLPVLFLQQPCKPGEDQQEQHHPDTQAVALNLRRLAHVSEESDGITHEGIVLLRIHATRCNL